MKVCKFGGSSLADAEQVRKVCDIVLADPDRRIVVVSAPGSRRGITAPDGKKDPKVTDLLIACAQRRLSGESADGEMAKVMARFAEIQSGLGVPDAVLGTISAGLSAALDADGSHRGRFMDAVKAVGEDSSAKLVAAALRSRGANARYVDPKEAGMRLSDEFGNAQVLPESYEHLSALKDREGITVFPGFFGYTRDGTVATFPRGGSDITGSILSAAVSADGYENFTDIDSVLAADPTIVPQARPIPELTYREMRELSYAGFSVLHDEAIVPAVRAGIPICVKNTNNPGAPGTRITMQRRLSPGAVIGIASSAGFCTVFISKYLMNREIGFGRRVLQMFEEEGVSFEHAPSGIDSMSVILREDVLDGIREGRIMERLRDELNADDVSIERGLALIMVVGEGMRYAVGLAARATRAIAEAGVNIEMMNQGSSEISMMFGVTAQDRAKAVRSLYEEFFDVRGKNEHIQGTG